MTLSAKSALVCLAVSCLGLTACAGSSSVTASANTAKKFDNVLVITIAGDYNLRSQFERVTVSNLRAAGVSAAAWYSVAGGNRPVVQEDVISAIRDQGFDSVLAIRQLDGDVEMKVKKSRTEIDATPIGGRIVNLFRSDYTDYKTPGSIDFATMRGWPSSFTAPMRKRSCSRSTTRPRRIRTSVC